MSPVHFNLRSWNSNSDKVRALAVEQDIHDADAETKVLGLLWNTEDDLLKLQERHLSTNRTEGPITKRDVLRESARIYDPLGILCPVTIRAKIFIQKLWAQGYNWDEPLPEELQTTWIGISNDLESATRIRVQRRYFPSLSTWPSKAILHIFVDASVKAYGAVAYISSGTHTAMVISKSRVAPLKQLTLPQLELMAAVVGARLASYLTNQLSPTQTVFWSDSQIVLHWLSSTKELKRFVQNRVNEIRQTTSHTNWNYCPSPDNPADLLTRGIPAADLHASNMWNHGPSWLTQPDNWPCWDPKIVLLQSSVHDVEPPSNPSTPPTDNHPSSTLITISQIINATHFSELQRLLRVTAWVIRFVDVVRKRSTYKTEALSPKEIDRAMNTWIQVTQRKTYHNELANLKQVNASRLPLVRQLRLFTLQDHIIRCGGRIHNAPVEQSAKFPILLPPNEHFTMLVVNDTHKRTLHSGLNHTLTAVRQRFWIPTGRQYVKKLLHRCVTCRKVLGRPYEAPDPPPLPACRLTDSPPFTVTGVDFTGAIYVKTQRGQEKVYICLFTCASTRALHLEVVTDLSVPTFMNAFRRFASRKSLPQVMVSDNASTYQSAAEELSLLFSSTDLQTHLNNRGIEWKFIPKRAPWYGGFWERLIGLTKQSLKKVLGKANINIKELQTVVTEIEAALNDRPLTYCSSELNDEGPLTPSHLLYGRRITTLPYPLHDSTEVMDPTFQPKSSDIRNQAKAKNDLLQHFWKRWQHEYVTSLREFHKVTGRNENKIKVGDVVQVHDDSKRVTWKLAVVESLIEGEDGLVRAANIRTSNGYTNRPITKLYPLEVTLTTSPTDSDEPKPSTESEIPSQVPPPTRPTRVAAQRAREKMKDYIAVISRPPEDVED
jgi:transposase InsO family protein